jgi:hypothetical protein
MCVARLLSSEPFRRGRQGANAANATRTAEGGASRPLAHKAGEHVHAGGCSESPSPSAKGRSLTPARIR